MQYDSSIHTGRICWSLYKYWMVPRSTLKNYAPKLCNVAQVGFSRQKYEKIKWTSHLAICACNVIWNEMVTESFTVQNRQDAQLSQTDCAAGCISFGQKWKTCHKTRVNGLSCGIRMRAQLSFVLSQITCLTDWQNSHAARQKLRCKLKLKTKHCTIGQTVGGAIEITVVFVFVKNMFKSNRMLLRL